MRVVLDTNVYLAAFLTRGLSAEVLDFVANEHELISSQYIVKELENKLLRKFKVPAKLAKKMQNLLLVAAEICEVERVVVSRCRDPLDNHILALAAESKADVIVTGDKDLLSMEEYQTVEILSPRQFWEKAGPH